MIRITLRDKDDVVKVLSGLPQRLRAAVLQAFQDITIEIQSRAKITAPMGVTGQLRLRIAQHAADEGGKIIGEVGSGMVYAPVVEEGRQTGWLPPPENLRTWARKKLGDDRLAFVVARAIQRRGFRAQPYLRPAMEAVLPRVESIFQKRIAEALGGNT